MEHPTGSRDPADRAADARRREQEITGEERLTALGYTGSFHRRLSLRGNIALTLSDITPAGSLLVVGIAVVSVAGTGSVIAYLIGAALAVMVALCMAELGSIFPISGGIYSIVGKVLGQHVAFLSLVGYIVQAIFLPASIALGIGTYLHSLDSSLDVGIWSAVAMLVVTGLALLKIQANAIMTAIFLVLEMVVIVVIAIVGYSHISQPVSTFTSPVGVVDNQLTAFGTGAVIAAVAIAMQSVNGYDAAIAFAEETKGAARTVGKAVLYSCLIGIVLEVGAFVASAVGAPDLNTYLTSSTPLTYVVKAHWGQTAATIVIVGAIIAFFNACLAITLQFARILWASGRDEVWPHVISGPLAKVHPRTGTPWVSTLLVGLLATVLCLTLSLVAAVTFVSVFTIANYVFIAVAALVHRLRNRDAPRPFRMPLWPVPPVIAGLGALLAISQQSYTDIGVVVGLFILGLIYWALYLRPKHRDLTSLVADADDAPTTPSPTNG